MNGILSRIMTSRSVKDINQQHIEYILFHRNGICSTILDKTLTNGQILILSRFLNLVFKKNLLPITELPNEDFAKLLSTLLKGLKLQKNNYYWTITLSILSQECIIELFCQSKQMIRTFKNIFLDKDPKIYSLIRSTILSISHLMIKLLETLISKSTAVNYNMMFDIVRICCYMIIHLLHETGIAGTEIQKISKFLFEIQNKIKMPTNNSNHIFILKHEAISILMKLNEDNVLVCRKSVISFLKNVLPYLAYHFTERGVINLLCNCCGSMLQQSADSYECVRLITMAGRIIYLGSKISSTFLEDESNVKDIMEFIKVVPRFLEHSDARNVLWWHILCSISPNIFQTRFKTYFIPFLENILGEYLNKNKSTYGISEFNLSNGYLHLSQLTNHVLINIINNMNLQKNCRIDSNIIPNVLVPNFMNYARLRQDLFASDNALFPELYDYVMKAIELWISILKYNKPKENFTDEIKVSKATRVTSKKSCKKIESFSQDIKRQQETKLNKINCENKNFTKKWKIIDRKSKFNSLQSEAVQTLLNTKKLKHLSKSNKIMYIPEIKVPTVNTDSSKDKVFDSIKLNLHKVPISNHNISEMKGLLDFFKGKNKNNFTDKHNNPIENNFIRLTPKVLPLKKRFNFDFDINPVADNCSYITSQAFDSQLNSNTPISKIRKKHKPPFSKSDPVKISPKRRRFHRSDLHNNNSVYEESEKIQPIINKSFSKNIPKSNIDFSLNVCESSNCPDTNDTVKKKNQVRTKKLEFRIKLDLNPLSKISSTGNISNISGINIPRRKYKNSIVKQ